MVPKIVSIGLICLSMAGCYLLDSPIERAREEILAFHAAFNANEYNTINTRSSLKFKVCHSATVLLGAYSTESDRQLI